MTTKEYEIVVEILEEQLMEYEDWQSWNNSFGDNDNEYGKKSILLNDILNELKTLEGDVVDE